jgi:hypothetical protein
MDPQPDRMAFGPFLGTLALGDNAVFLEELIGRLLEGRPVIQYASLVLALQPEVPSLGGRCRPIL